MEERLVVINFKTYEEALGFSADKLARIMSNLETEIRLIAVVSPFDLSLIHI